MDRPPLNPRLALLPGVLAVSTASLFVRLVTAPPLAVTFWRTAISAIAFLPFFAFPAIRRQWCAIPAKSLIVICAASSFSAIHNIFFVLSLKFTSVAASVILVNTHPILTAFLGHLFIKEKVTARAALGLVGAMAGAAIISISHGGNISLRGNLFALATALFMAAFILCARRLRQRTPILPFMFAVKSASSVYLLLLVAVFAVPLIGFDVASWRALLLLGLVPTFIGHTVFNYSVGYLRAYLVALALVGEPVGATILAVIFLGEIPSLQTMIGGLIVLVSILVAVLEKAHHVAAASHAE